MAHTTPERVREVGPLRPVLVQLLLLLLVISTGAPAAAQAPGRGPHATCRLGAPLSLQRPRQAGPDVAWVQQRLLESGFDPGPVDGVFGPRTARAVRALQRQRGLGADGKVDPHTWLALEPVAAVAGLEPFVPPARGQFTVTVDLRRQRLTLLVNGFAVRSWRVAVGKARTPSPVGDWRVTRKARNWGDGFGTRWIGLNVPWGIYGIHGTNKPWSIGQNLSAGCIRMHNRDVEALYDLIPVGARVLVFGADPWNRRSLVNGSRGSDVMEVQTRLAELGLYHGPRDGIFGPGTEQAVRRFQRDRGLRADGVVRWDTFKALGPVPEPKGSSPQNDGAGETGN